ncbi:helix-turn-helix domain-containing protein, partial [Streptomyces scabiei]
MPTENELLSNVDALLEQVAQDDLPPPAERRRLREAAGLSQAQVAKALDTRREAVGNWEAGRTEPRPPQRAAYARLLERLAERFPAPKNEAPGEPAVPETFAADPAPAVPAPSEQTAVEPPAQPSSTARPSSTSRRPGAKKAAPKKTTATAAPAVDSRFENGPLAVV